MKRKKRKPLDELLRAYERSGSYRQAAASCAWPESSARRALKIHGVMQAPPGPPDAATVDEWQAAYLDGASLKSIAESWSRYHGTVANALRERGIKLRARGERAGGVA